MIAWGGIIAQFFIFLLAIAIEYLLIRFSPQMYLFLLPLFFVFIRTNLLIAAFNLIPVKPLDGYLAWRVIPLCWNRYFPAMKGRMRRLSSSLKFTKRRALDKESKRLTDELINRIKDKQ